MGKKKSKGLAKRFKKLQKGVNKLISSGDLNDLKKNLDGLVKQTTKEINSYVDNDLDDLRKKFLSEKAKIEKIINKKLKTEIATAKTFMNDAVDDLYSLQKNFEKSITKAKKAVKKTKKKAKKVAKKTKKKAKKVARKTKKKVVKKAKKVSKKTRSTKKRAKKVVKKAARKTKKKIRKTTKKTSKTARKASKKKTRRK